jgi:transposase-like protein
MDDQTSDNAVYDFKQIHFAINVKAKRTTVMLEGYLVKALQRKHGLADNTAIRTWIEQAIKADGDRFDSIAPLTRQTKRIIIESFLD